MKQSEAFKIIEKHAEALRDLPLGWDKDPKIRRVQSVVKALELNPELYKQYNAAEPDELPRAPESEIHKAGSLKAIAYGALERLAKSKKRPDETKEGALARVLGTPEGQDLYRAYLDA